MRPLIVTLTLAALAGPGCGGEDDGGGTGGPTTRVAAGRPLVVTASEYALTPAEVVAGPGELRVRLRNSGSLPHDLRIQRGDRDLGGTESIPGGESATATVDLPPGRYRMLCTVGDHAQLGMKGALRVKE